MVFEKIDSQIGKLKGHMPSVKRRAVLLPLITYIQEKVDLGAPVSLNFICTHNSRRSHLAQVWAQTFAHYFELENVRCFSGGTEATAVYPMVVETLQNSGFSIKMITEADNPLYHIRFSENATPIKAFSKVFNNAVNPTANFSAVMTCSHADENCPFVSGTDKRIAITYDDPKEFDNTPQKAQKYQERSLQIAAEMHYVFSQINCK